MKKIDPEKYLNLSKRKIAKGNAFTDKIKKQSSKIKQKAARKNILTIHKNTNQDKIKRNEASIFDALKLIFTKQSNKITSSDQKKTARKNNVNIKITRSLSIGRILLVVAVLLYIIISVILKINNTPIVFTLPFDIEKNKIEITDTFGARLDPFTGEEGDFHHGIDFALNWHSPILAAAEGKVTYSGTNESLGNYVMIRHKQLYTLYAHLSAVFVAEGDKVAAGQTIGLEGGDPLKDPNPGSSTGDHLHFAMLDKNENYLNPADYLNLK